MERLERHADSIYAGIQLGTVNPSSLSQIAQSTTIPDRTPRPYTRMGRPSGSHTSQAHQHPIHNIHIRTSSAITTSGLPFTTSTAYGPSSRRFGSLSSQPSFNINTDITISDHLERRAKRAKHGLSRTQDAGLDPIQRRVGVIDLENKIMSKVQTAEISKLKMGHYEKPHSATTVQMPSRLNPGSNLPGGFLAGDYMTEEKFNTWLQQSQGKNAPVSPMRTPHLPLLGRPTSAKPTLRNGPILPPLVLLKSYNHNGSNLTPHVNVELQNGDFMRIVHVMQNNSTSAVSLRGHIFQRTREMNGVLRKALNEVCWVLHVHEDDGREQSIQAMGDVPVSHVVKRRAIKMTNRPFPALSFRTDLLMDETEEVVSRNRVLVCRWKYICYYRSAEARDRNAYSQRVIQRIQMRETDINCAVEDEKLRYNWRGETIKGGAALEDTASGHLVATGLRSLIASPFALDPKAVIDLEPPTRTSLQNYHSQRDSRGRSGSDRYSKTASSASAGLRKSVNNRPPTQFPCDSFDSVISIEDDPDPDFRMNPRTASASHNMKAQVQHQSPEVIEVEGYVKEGPKKGVFKQAYKGDVTSWRSHPPPHQWSAGFFDGGASSPSNIVQQRGSRESSQDSDRTLRGRSPSLEFLGEVLKHVVPSCPEFQPSQQRNISQASNAIKHTPGYTYGDGFCGAGGMSRGAVMAGLNVKWGFDYNDLACKSYLLNFRSLSTSVYCISADQFSSLQGEDHKVDVLHLSPPCQTFSPAHTINGKDDDQNSASLFAVSELLKKARPRVVSLEQTAGLKTLYPQYLNALVQMFTENDFNIRYKICHLQEYGLPQTRSRLIIIASCPGEALPEYPTPTHSSDPQHTGLRPLSTINKAIRNIPPDAADQDLAKVMNTSAGPPYNGNRQTNCITTSGGGVYHPSGRKFTHREIACLNGFPLEHRFCGKGTKKQIGNAVPPMVGKIFLEAIRKALEMADSL